MLPAVVSPRFEISGEFGGFTPGALCTAVVLAVPGDPRAAPALRAKWEARALDATVADAICAASGTLVTAA